ncbi:hypothetical protein MSG28_006919 [Choristoneura fumiferana]|uniref:Uncharacterized protein n=1 Tax=Choristoneura fumiferana TaxID=7141 RepID=A0ACC0JLM8_CHOFU|nr:hypothetical protein MSG28_006919 [Choristoneura fumiferana]
MNNKRSGSVVDYSSTRPFVTLSIIKINMNLEYEFQFQHGKEGVKNNYTYISVEYEHESPLHIQMVMAAELICPNDRVASELAGGVLTHDVHVVVT